MTNLETLGFRVKCTGGNCFAYSLDTGDEEILICTEDSGVNGNFQDSEWIAAVYSFADGEELFAINEAASLEDILTTLRREGYVA